MAKSIGEKPMSDADWQAQNDARVIADAEIVKKDPTRMAAAQKMADKLAKETMDQMDRMKMEHDALSNLAMKDKKKDMGNTPKSKADKPKKIEKKQVKKMDKPKVKKAK